MATSLVALSLQNQVSCQVILLCSFDEGKIDVEDERGRKHRSHEYSTFEHVTRGKAIPRGTFLAALDTSAVP